MFFPFTFVVLWFGMQVSEGNDGVSIGDTLHQVVEAILPTAFYICMVRNEYAGGKSVRDRLFFSWLDMVQEWK